MTDIARPQEDTGNPYLRLAREMAQGAGKQANPFSDEALERARPASKDLNPFSDEALGLHRDNPYLAIVEEQQRREQQRMRTLLEHALANDPDLSAEKKRLAQTSGLPFPIVDRNVEQIRLKEQAKAIDLMRMAKDSPVLYRQLTDPQFARIAVDDVENLGAVEVTLRKVAQFARSVAAGMQGMPADFVYGGARAAAETLAPLLDPLAGTVLPENPLRRVAAGFAGLQRDAQAFSRRIQGDTSSLGFVEQAINDGGRSLGGNLVALPLGLVGGARAALTPLVGSEFGRSYGTARDRGLGQTEALAFGASQAAIEYATEKIPVSRLLGDIKAGTTLLRMAGRQAVTEIPGEQIATILQDLNEWAALNPDKSLRSFIDNYAHPSVRGSAALHTLIATVVGVGGQTTVAKGIDTALSRFGAQEAKAKAAQDHAHALAGLADLSGQSKLRGRDAQTFEQFVREAADGSPLQEVFIPAETLAQALGPNLEQVASQVPAIAEQLDEALATGGTLAIPVEQFAARVPSELAQSLIPHLRTTPEAMSLAEAQTFGQQGQEGLQAEIAALVDAVAPAPAADALEAVRTAVLDQLKTAGRFTGDVNQGYAELLTRFFEATAERAGIDLQTLVREMGPRIVSQIGTAAGQLDQTSPQFRSWFADSKVVDAEGAPLVVYHGSPDARFVDEDGTFATMKERMLRFGATPESKRAAKEERGFFFTTSQAVAKTYANPSRAFDYQNAEEGVIPVYLSLQNPMVFDAGGKHWREAQREISKDDFIKAAKTAGHDGVIIRNVRDSYDSLQTGRDPMSDVFVAFDSEQIKHAERNDGSYDADDRNILSQTRRGAYDPATRTIALLSQADLSTFVHEAAHYFLEVQAELAGREGADAGLQADMQTLLAWFGVPDLATWQGMSLEQKRPHHEQFARGFEAFAFEGLAPSQELQSVFQRFRGWLLRVYRSLTALNVELSPEVRQVFGRMIATEDQIQRMEALRSYRPLFESAEAAGMTEEEWVAYQATGAQATQDAVGKLQRRSLADMQWLANARSRALSKLQRDARAKREAVRAEVAAEVDALPIYQAWRDLTRGKTAEGFPVRLNLREIRDQWPEFADKLGKTMATNEGSPAEMVADAYGLDSADQLVKLLATLDPPNDVIEAQTEERMLERYGDLTDPDTIARAADEVIHNDARARFLEREVNALGKAVGSPPVVTRAAREYAEEAIARKKVREIKPAQYSAAESRAARAAEEAFRKGDTAAAAARKREQLLQHQLARVAHRAVAEVERAVDYLGKFDTDATRKAIGPEYAEQIDQLLERYDLRPSTTLKEIGRRKSLSEWVEEQRSMGLEPNIDERLITDAALISFKEMTLEDLRGLVDTIKNIEHLGRLKQRLLTVQDQRRFDEIVTEVAQSIEEHGGKPREIALEGRKGVIPWLQGVWASHRKISSLVRQMDGGKDNGPLWRVLVRGMNDAGNREQVLIEQATMKLAELYAPLLKMRGGLAGGKVFIPEIGASLSRGGRLSVALNWGNAANRHRLLDGEGWGPGQVGAILATLGREELAFVNQAWEFIDSYWPAVEAKQLRVDGIAPEKVKAEPFTLTLADGSTVQMRGGYYPIKYDADRSSRAESQEAAEVAKDMLRGAFTRATTRRGHTKARAETVKRPIRKDLDVITQHVSQVVHDLAWHEWLIDANRLVGSKVIDDAIRTHYGPEVVRTLKDDLAGIAAGDLAAQTAIDRALLTLRANVSRSTMGLSLTTAMLQPFGLTQSMARIGTKPVLRGLARWAGDATRLESSMEWIGEKSDFMRLRSKTFNRELTEIRGRVGGQSQLAQVRDGVLFFLTTKLQLVADVPTWIGRYEQAIAAGQDEATAVALADQAVIDSQGAGTAKDLAEVQRKHPFLTQFYSYFSTTLNLVAEKTATTDFRNPRAVAGWLGDMALLAVVPALAPALVLSALRGEDDEDLAKQLAQAQAGYLLGLLVGARELSGVVSGYPYSGPPVTRVVTDAGKAAQQASQGEVDEPAVMAVVRLLGSAFGIPTVQAIRSYKGWKAWEEGDAPPTAILFGPPQKD